MLPPPIIIKKSTEAPPRKHNLPSYRMYMRIATEQRFSLSNQETSLLILEELMTSASYIMVHSVMSPHDFCF